MTWFLYRDGFCQRFKMLSFWWGLLFYSSCFKMSVLSRRIRLNFGWSRPFHLVTTSEEIVSFYVKESYLNFINFIIYNYCKIHLWFETSYSECSFIFFEETTNLYKQIKINIRLVMRKEEKKWCDTYREKVFFASDNGHFIILVYNNNLYLCLILIVCFCSVTRSNKIGKDS